MTEPKTIEQLARDAGWVETTLGECREGDEVLSLSIGTSGRVESHKDLFVQVIASNGMSAHVPPGFTVLRAPRPEPKYEIGTVARIRRYGQEFNALYMGVEKGVDPNAWLIVSGGDRVGVSGVPPRDAAVLRIIAYPDGTSPESGPVTDEQVLATVNTRRKRLGYARLESPDALNQTLVEEVREDLEAARLTPVKAEENITLEKIRETGKVAVDEDGNKWHWKSGEDQFIYWDALYSSYRPVYESSLIAATESGHFTHWADEQEAGE